MGRRFIGHFIKICSPFYNPAKRPEPKGYREYLKSFDVRYDNPPAAVAA